MRDPALDALIAALRRGDYRCRTAILLLPPDRLAAAPDIAARHELDTVDFAAQVLARVPSGSSRIRMTEDALFGILDALAAQASGSQCVLVTNLDLGVAALPADQRRSLWGRLCGDMPRRPRALIFAMPAGADHLLPPEEDAEQWRRFARMLSLEV